MPKTRAPRILTDIPSDFPHPQRAGGSDLFRSVLGGAPKSTFARWLELGVIERGVSVGGRSLWSETYMAKVAREGASKPQRDDAALA